MSNQNPLPMRRRLVDMSDDEQCKLLEAMNSFLGGIVAQILIDGTAPTAGRRDAPAPADDFKREALQEVEAMFA